MRRSDLFTAGIFTLSVVLTLGVWLTSIPFATTALQNEVLRSYATLLILGATYLILFWKTEEQRLPFWVWIAFSAAVGSVALVDLDPLPGSLPAA